MNNAVLMHATYGEQGQTVPEMCELAARCGYDGVEFRGRASRFQGTREEYLDAIVRGMESHKLRAIRFGGPGANLMSSDVATRQRETDDLIDFLKLAAKRFAPTVLLTYAGALETKQVPYFMYEKQGSAIATPEQWEWAAEGFRAIGQCAAELGWKVAFETHMTYIHDLVPATRKLVDLIGHPSVGITLDYANLLYFPNPPTMQEAISQCGDRLFHVHVKNFVKVPSAQYQSEIRCGLADGLINHREFLRHVKAAGYDGPISIEAPRPGDREEFATQDLAYLRRVMQRVN